MNLKTNPFKFLLSIIAIFALVSQTSFAKIKLNQQQYNDDRDERDNAISSQDENKFEVPFVVLMSSHEVCVAQLPLIGYGNVSVVYRLVDDHDWAESADETQFKKEENKIADAREFEQMPKSSLSLGKSERQQIAAGELYPSNDREEVGKRSNEDAAVRGTEESAQKEGPTRILPRKKRTNSVSSAAYAGNSLLATNHGPVNNRDASQSSVQESSSATPAVNVTSARSWNEREEVVRRGRAEEDEPKNGAVQLADFDVHMRLGFAFVADTRGRIYRFKLSGYGDGNPPENDYTNSIGTGVGSDDPRSMSLKEASSSTQQPGTRNSAQSDVTSSSSDSDRAFSPNNSGTYDDDGVSLTGSDNANKVGLFTVAGEKYGRHPTASGAEQSGKLAFVGSGSDGSPAFDSTAGPSSHATNDDKRSPTAISSARPRIIWSRTKHGIIAHQATSVDGVPSQPEHERGALSSVKHNLSSKSNTQMANDTEQMENDSEEPLSERHHTINVSGGSTESADQTSDSTSRRRSNGAHEPRTEVAVDWQNNLLFVLDKYRLSVVDYEGNNELVLIDDFNHQPVNLKADPTNGFLFWLQVGKFHNTIYKLDLNVLDKYQNGSSHDASLISHHYAHPIVTNLPTHARLFIIDHKHSRIYVPLSTQCDESSEATKTQRVEDAEIFSTPSDESNIITHMNSTSTVSNEVPIDLPDERNSTVTGSNSMLDGQILAYNLDGTDVGPLRSPKKSSHPYNFDDILDITMDTNKGLLYWLTNDGRDLFEEYQGGNDSPYHQAQHNLEGKRYRKLLHFDSGYNQPASKPRFNLAKLFSNLATKSATNRLARSDRLNSMDDQGSAFGLNGLPSSDQHLSGFSRFAVIILGGVIVASLFGIIVYFVARPSLEPTNCIDNHNSGSSIGGSFMGESHVDSVAHTSGFIGASTISRWIQRPSTSSADTSTFNRSLAKNAPLNSCDLESSTNYGQSNAIDEHYRDSVYDQAISQMEQNCLTNLARWPSNMCDMSNRLYVPIELLEDETLSSIHRVSIEQLHIEKRAPLGEGHFGTVLQGTITCSVHEKDIMMNKSSARSVTGSFHPFRQYDMPRETLLAQGLAVPSSSSSGHGSSSISSEFVTANSVVDATRGDYLLPKSNTNSATSDYSIENSHSVTVESYISNPEYRATVDLTRETKFKVAIKKLKENASPKERSDFLQEAKHLAKFDHPNIVSLIGICLDRGSTLIIMELMLGGDLIRYMQENKPTSDNQDKLTFDDLLSICLDIASACCYLEEHEHIHRDLAARNCLVSSRKRDERVVKLADFGLARDIYKDSYYKKLNDSAMPLKWMAPECFMEQKFTIKSDVWSFGVVMWEVMSYCQDKPYNNVEHFMMKDHLIEGLRLGRPEHCSEDIYRLMNECWQLDPARRPTFEECRATLIEIKSSGS